MSDYDTQPQVEEQYDSEHDVQNLGTFSAEPASEDAWAPEKEGSEWNDMGLTPQEQFDILFGYAEERHIEKGRRH